MGKNKMGILKLFFIILSFSVIGGFAIIGVLATLVWMKNGRGPFEKHPILGGEDDESNSNYNIF